jgi:hypothetical protein
MTFLLTERHMTTSLKTCRRCKEEKPLHDFGRKKISADGLNWWCKKCNVEANTAYRKTENGSVKLKEYRNSDRGRMVAKNADKKFRSSEKWKIWIDETKDKYAFRRRARRMAMHAVYMGRLDRKPCEVCGTNEKIEAHHDDYSKPLDVRWLCQAHHRQWHAEHKEGYGEVKLQKIEQNNHKNQTHTDIYMI